MKKREEEEEKKLLLFVSGHIKMDGSELEEINQIVFFSYKRRKRKKNYEMSTIRPN